MVRTEDTGKKFEMGICLAYGIPYDGTYSYTMDLPHQLKPRLEKLKERFPMCKHTAKRGARYDYTAVEDESLHLSAKSTKKGIGKVAPQVIGQAQPEEFCRVLEIPYTNVADLKKYIQEHPTAILPQLVAYTFNCPNLYYNEEQNSIRYIVLSKPIDWSQYTYEWTRPHTEWTNSSTLKIGTPQGPVALVEFQFHSRSRTNMAVRWCYETFLTVFKDHLTIESF
jgi:hypothetical protein